MNESITGALTNLTEGSSIYFLREHLQRTPSPARVLEALEGLSELDRTRHVRAQLEVLRIFR